MVEAIEPNTGTNRSATATARLIARLDDALELFDEPLWTELRNTLAAESASLRTEAQSAEWYRADPARLATEKAALSRLMRPIAECPDLFYIREDSRLLGAVGLAALDAGERVRLDVLFPGDYPDSAPRVFFTGDVAGSLASLLMPDGAIPVPFGAERQWKSDLNGAFVVSCAIDWLKRVVRVETSPDARGLRPRWNA